MVRFSSRPKVLPFATIFWLNLRGRCLPLPRSLGKFLKAKGFSLLWGLNKLGKAKKQNLAASKSKKYFSIVSCQTSQLCLYFFNFNY